MYTPNVGEHGNYLQALFQQFLLPFHLEYQHMPHQPRPNLDVKKPCHEWSSQPLVELATTPGISIHSWHKQPLTPGQSQDNRGLSELVISKSGNPKAHSE